MYKLTLLLLSVTLLFSCQKFDKYEEVSPEITSASKPTGIMLEEYVGNDGHIRNILVFSSDKAYFNKIEELEEAEEKEEQEFLNNHPDATEEEINRYDSIEHYDEYKVYKDFASYLKFNALLYHYIDAENSWLNNSDLDENLNPDLLFFGLSKGELAVLNVDFAYKIKNDKVNFIVKHFPDGIAVITDGDYSTLNYLSRFKKLADIDLTNLKNVQSSFTSSFSCTSWNREVDYRTIEPRLRLYGVTRVTRFFVVWGYVVAFTKVRATAKTYKKLWWCNCWRKYRVSSLRAAIDGKVYIDACGGSLTHTFDKNVDFREKHNRSTVTYRLNFPVPYDAWPFDRIYVEDDKLWGHFYAKGIEWFKLDFYDGDWIQIH